MTEDSQQAQISKLFENLKFPSKREPLTVDGIYRVNQSLKRDLSMSSMNVEPCYGQICSFNKFNFENPTSIQEPHSEGIIYMYYQFDDSLLMTHFSVSKTWYCSI